MPEEELQTMSEQEPAEASTTEATPETDTLDAELDKIYEGQANEAPAPEQSQAAEQPQTPPEEDVPYPTTWSKENQELFKTLPLETKKQIAKREQEREAVVRESFAARRFAQAITPVARALGECEEYFKTFCQENGQPLWGNAEAMAREIKTVLNAKMMLAKDPAAALHIMRQWATQNTGWQPSESDEDSEALTLRARLAQMEQAEQTRLHQQQAYQQQMQQQQAYNALANHVNALGNSTDENGKAMFPHLHGEHAERVGYAMGQWLRANMGQQGITPELYKQAYETAIFAVPETRELEFKAREDARVAQFKQRSEAARKAQGINPSAKRAPESVPETSLEQDMEAIWAKYST